MAENIALRVGRIISGSINAVVGAVEGAAPEVIMEQAIREVDLVIDDVRTDLGKVIAEKHHANKRLFEKNAKHEDLGQKIELAVKEGQDTLAEAGIATQMDIEAQIPVLEQTVAACADKEKELESYISALQAKKREMEDELRSYKTTSGDNSSSGEEDGVALSANGGNSTKKRIENAESAFGRVLEKQTGVPSMNTSDIDQAKKLADLEDLARANRIKERLEAIKNS